MTTGKPIRSVTASACSVEVAMPFGGCFSLRSASRCWNRSRSSARSMASGVVPRDRHAGGLQAAGEFQGVCPPNCTIRPSSVPADFSTRTISSTSSTVSGSK